jgi:hypothetical protein
MEQGIAGLLGIVLIASIIYGWIVKNVTGKGYTDYKGWTWSPDWLEVSEEVVKEMTVADIEKALGHSVKVVK